MSAGKVGTWLFSGNMAIQCAIFRKQELKFCIVGERRNKEIPKFFGQKQKATGKYFRREGRGHWEELRLSAKY